MHVADHLTTDQLHALAGAAADKRRFVRIRAVILALEGRTAPEGAAALGCSRRAAQDWIARSSAEGLAGLDERPRSGRPSFLDGPATERLRARLDAGPTPEDGVCTLRGPEICALLERESGVLDSPAAVYALLHRLGDSCLDPRPRHRKADPEAREAFKKSRRAPRRRRPGPPRKVGRGLVGGRGAVRPEGDADDRLGPPPTAVRQMQYDSLWVIAAACPAAGAAAGIVMPHLDTPRINTFLEQLSAQLAPDAHAAPIRDGAGFHTSGSLTVPANVSPIRLPPDSPELDPIENLWHYLRSHDWSNRVYEDWEALKAAACSALVAVGADAERIKSVCAAPSLDCPESGNERDPV